MVPGDVLTCRVEVEGKTAYSDERGQIDLRIELSEKSNGSVFSFVGLIVVKRRE